MARRLYTLVVLVALAGCHRAQDTLAPSLPIAPTFLSADTAWVDSVLASLSMEEQVAQLLMVPIYAREDTGGWAEAERWTRELGLGGVICMQVVPTTKGIDFAGCNPRPRCHSWLPQTPNGGWACGWIRPVPFLVR